MEHAIWIKASGQEEFISIKKIKAELGEDGVRRERYKCPSKKCAVMMRPVLPKKVRRNGKEVHSDHFRATPVRHTPDCQGDGEREDDIDDSIKDGVDTKPRHDVVKGGSHPMKYVRRLPRRVGGNEPPDGGGEPGPEGGNEPEGEGVRGDTHTSKPETGHIRRIVEAYENPPYARSAMPLILPGCPAKNYEDAFMEVAQAPNASALMKAPYIYKGAYDSHCVYGDNGIVIYFSRTFGTMKVSVWIEKTLEPDASRTQIKRLLWRARNEQRATIYIFGVFRLHENWKYTVDIKAFGDLWITFPANAGE